MNDFKSMNNTSYLSHTRVFGTSLDGASVRNFMATLAHMPGSKNKGVSNKKLDGIIRRQQGK